MKVNPPVLLLSEVVGQAPRDGIDKLKRDFLLCDQASYWLQDKHAVPHLQRPTCGRYSQSPIHTDTEYSGRTLV